MTVVSSTKLRAALNMDPTGPEEVELVGLLQGAEAEYVEHVGPLPGSYTKTVVLPAHLPRGATSVTAPTGVVYDEETRRLDHIHRSRVAVEVSYVVGDWPEHHKHAIVADVAEYWERTQRTGGEAGRPGFGDGFDGGGGRAPRPVTMYPRIRALATGWFA